jgi:hypothetical protein
MSELTLTSTNGTGLITGLKDPSAAMILFFDLTDEFQLFVVGTC